MVGEKVTIPADDAILNGILTVPEVAVGIVLFVHGSGSSRLSPRNQMVAEVLQHAGFATLLFDLLTEGEEREDSATGIHRFNIQLLAGRLVSASAWVSHNRQTAQVPMGYFGASTGSAAALIAAAKQPFRSRVKAIVSRGGRPDLAGTFIPAVTAPTLLIVGGYDTAVIDINRAAFKKLNALKALKIVPGASHLFEESGKLIEVARLSADWFKQYLLKQADKTEEGITSRRSRTSGRKEV